MKHGKEEIAESVYKVLERNKKYTKTFLYDEKIKEAYECLYPGIEGSKKQKEFVLSKIKLALMILLVGGLLTGGLWIKELQTEKIEDNQIIRKEYGEGSKQIHLQATQEKENVDISFVVEEKEFTTQELEECYEEFLIELEEKILGENVSFQLITYDLTLCEALEPYPYEIEWCVDEEYIGKDGHLLQEELEEAQTVSLIARISYKDFYREEIFEPCIYSRAIKETFQEKLVKSMETLEENTRMEKNMILPKEYEGKTLIWKNKVEHRAYLGFFIVPILVLVLLLCKNKDLSKLVEERQIQLNYDYPEIVSKLALYIGAGMTTQGAFIKIAREYEKRNKKKKYAYEEMLICVREIENGRPVGQAFELFGRRCQNPNYMKMSTLLSQHIKKGNAHISEELMSEASWAFEERKQQVRQQGEKTGTKMLVPMMILLFIVMTMILAPAFLNQI